MNIALRIHDPAGTAARDVVVQAEDGSTVRDLIEALVDVLEWPRTAFDGDPLAYRARLLGSADALDDGTLVSALELVQGTAVVLGPVALPPAVQESK